MRKTIGYLVLLVFVGITFIGCKKGENDPFLSLKSRTARIIGVWNLKSADFDENTTGNTDETYNYSFEENKMTKTLNGDGETYDYSETVTIDKNGTFIIEILEEELHWNFNFGTMQWESGIFTTTYEGVWYFLEGNQALDVKDKERIEFLIEKQKIVDPAGGTEEVEYSGQSNSFVQILLLDRLANKEIVTIYDYMKTEGSNIKQKVGSSTYTQD